MTVPTGITHLPSSCGPLHSPALAAQSLTWIFLPGGITMPRDLSARSDHSGLFTSYGRTSADILVGFLGSTQPVSVSFVMGLRGSVGASHFAVGPVPAAPVPAAPVPAAPVP